MADKKVQYGLNNVHIAKLTESEGAISYETPFALEGAVNLNLDATGDTSTFYADNRPYYKVTAKTGYSGTLEIANVPERFLIDIMGQKKDTNGAIIENSENKESRFALMCEVDGDPSASRIVFYDCIATRPTLAFSTTEESTTVQTVTMNIEIVPRSSDRQVKGTLVLTEENKTVYDSFFSSVYEASSALGTI